MRKSPKTGEKFNNYSFKRKSKAINNYSKKNITKIYSNKTTFSRNTTQQSSKCQQSSRRIIQNPISTNSTSHNSSYKNYSNTNKQINNVFHHKKSVTSFNFMSFFSQNQTSKSNILNKNQPILNKSFFNELNEKENKSKEIFIKKIENKKIINKKVKKKNKTNPGIKILNNYNITTTRINRTKNKDKKIIINLANSPNNSNRVCNNKSLYQSKYLSPSSSSRNIVLHSQIQDLHSNINSFGKLKKIKYPKNISKDNNSIIKRYSNKNMKEKNNTDIFNKNISKNNNKSGNMFAIHKMIENNLFNHKINEKAKAKAKYLSKQISLDKKLIDMNTMSRNNSYTNTKILNNKSNLLDSSSNLIIFGLNQNNSEKNCLYKENSQNLKHKECFSLNQEENDKNNNKTYNDKINNKQKYLLNNCNINSIIKYEHSLNSKNENNYMKKNKEINKSISGDDKENNKNLLNIDRIEEKRIKKTISPIGNNTKNSVIYMNKNISIQNNKGTPEETHFEAIAFIQSIMNKNNNYQ